jgi:4-hydroxybenzoyl-CoA thioesterase
MDRPITVGEMVEVHACLTYTGRSSLHVLVTVHSGAGADDKTAQTAQCPTVFVAVDEVGAPIDVTPWTPVTMLELQRQRQARVRIRMRRRVEEAIAGQSYTADGAAPRATTRFRVSRADGNRGDTVHGGRCMRWIDGIANRCAADWTGAAGVTSYIAAIRFCSSVVVGDQVEVSPRMIHTGARSIHVGVRVVTTDVVSGGHCVAAEGLVVVVSLDERGDARSVPKWTADCDEDLRLDRHARHLAELRQFFEPYSKAI